MRHRIPTFLTLALLSLLGCSSDKASGSNSGSANAAPVFSSEPSKDCKASSLYTYTPKVSDADGDALTFKLISAPEGATFKGGSLSWQAPAKPGTSHTFELEVSDGKAQPVKQSWTVTLSAQSGSFGGPQFKTTPRKECKVGGEYQYMAFAGDLLGGEVTVTLKAKPDENVTFNSQSGVTILNWKAPEKEGNYAFALEAKDENGRTAEQKWTVKVTNENLVPFVEVLDMPCKPGSPYIALLNIEDDDPLDVVLLVKPEGALLAQEMGKWIVKWEKTPSMPGIHPFKIVVSDKVHPPVEKTWNAMLIPDLP